MSSYCARCGRERDGTLQYCGGCGAAFTEDSGPSGTQGTPAGATRADPAFDPTRTGQPAAAPDPFASWYQPQQPGEARGAVPGDAEGTWQPTQTVYAAPAGPAGFPPPAPGSAVPPAQPYPAGPPYQPAPPFPPGPGPSGGGRRGLFIAVVVIVVLAAGGGAYALASSLGKNSAAAPPSQPSTGSTTPGGGTAAGSTPAGGSASGGAPKQATTPATSPTPSPSLSLVAIGQGVTSSAAEPQVETLLSHYFHGINSRDYAEYASTLNPAEQAKQSQSTFQSGYATTTDSGMTLTTLASNGTGLVATVTFTSRQSPAQSVDHRACNAWTLNFYLVPQGTGYLIGPAPAGYQPSHSDC
jgi:hypothetical protein